MVKQLCDSNFGAHCRRPSLVTYSFLCHKHADGAKSGILMRRCNFINYFTNKNFVFIFCLTSLFLNHVAKTLGHNFYRMGNQLYVYNPKCISDQFKFFCNLK